jgi:hypothetical protein
MDTNHLTLTEALASLGLTHRLGASGRQDIIDPVMGVVMLENATATAGWEFYYAQTAEAAGHYLTDERIDELLGFDPHFYEVPTALESTMPGDINRRGYGPWGETVWIHGPEPLGPRDGARWAVRTRTLGSRLGSVWDGGCSIFTSREEAIRAFRFRINIPSR